MSKQKYSKTKALGYMFGTGVRGLANFCAEPYYSNHTGKKEVGYEFFGPMARNAVIFTGTETVKSALNGFQPTDVIIGLGLVIEGTIEGKVSYDLIEAGNKIKKYWEMSKNKAIARNSTSNQ
jgi:hypothetical protein